MSDDPKTNGTPQLQLKEGERFLFVRLGEDGAFQILFSDAQSALALHRMADTWLEENILRPSLAPQPKIGIPAGLDMSSLTRALKRTSKS